MGKTGFGDTGSFSDGWPMLGKSLTQFSADGSGCVPSLLFDLKPNYGGGNEDNMTSFKRSHVGTATPSAPDQQPIPLPESWTLPGKSGSVSCGVTAPSS